MKLSQEEIDSFNNFQKAGIFHPFTCGSGRRTDEAHLDGEGLLIATEDGLKCPYCEYTQDWCHEFMIDNSWQETENKMKNVLSIMATAKPDEGK